MNHFSYEQWKKYVKNEIDEAGRRVYEEHLYHCDQCLEVYSDALAACETDLPVIENEATFTDLVMEKIIFEKEDNSPAEWRAAGEGEQPAANAQTAAKSKEKQREKVPFYNRTSFHYAIAAAMTFILLSTGVFQKVTEVAQTVSTPNLEEKAPSLTEELLNKTFTFMDSINTKIEEGE